jgi:lipid A ethanolaminephosphotransferase
MAVGKWRLFSRLNTAVVSPQRLVVLVALALVVFFNASAWQALHTLVPLESLKVAAFYLSFAVFMVAFISLLLTLVSFKYLLKPALTLLLLCSASATYFMGSYGVSIDTVMVQNIFETNPAEAGALLSARMLGYIGVLGVLPAIVIWRLPVRYPPFFRGLLNKLVMMVACLVTVAVMVGTFYSTYAPIFRDEDKLTHYINPTNYIYAVSKYTKQRFGTKESLVLQQIGLDSKTGAELAARPKKALVIFVVGETARADHFALNGYARETNPELKKQDILNFTGVHSCGTSTAVSVPCMFSVFPRKDFSDKKGKTHEGALDVLQRAGIKVFWRDNNSDCKGTCLRIPSDDVAKRKNSPFCNDRRCLDEVMLEDLQAYIDTLDDNAMIVLHADGSHGPEYFDRYPDSFERFKPVCHTNQLSSCSTEELVNVYDNTILYTDHFLNQVIELLKRNAEQRDTAMIYVSDHGESLGENGLYLHAAPYSIAPESQTHVPMVMWFAPDAYKNWGIDKGCMQGKLGDPELSHDNVFHSLLGLFAVQSTVYQPQLDMFSSCRPAAVEQAKLSN